MALAVAMPVLAEEAPSGAIGGAPPPLAASIELTPAPSVAAPVAASPAAPTVSKVPSSASAPARASSAKPAPAKAAGTAPAVTSAKAPPSPPPEPFKLSNDPRPTLSPQTFVATMQAADRYRALVDAGGWPSVPSDVSRLKPGESSPSIATLKKRLVATGDMQEHEKPGTVFDETVAAGIRRFQARHGLEETGLIGPRTLTHLNIPAAQRLKQLEASAGRLMGSKFPFGERYVAVNIPSAAVEAVERGVVARRYVAVVGRPERASPTVETRITSVNFNPTWTVPVSIIKKDIIPHVRKDPGYLAKMHIRLFDAQGQEVDPKTIDWSTERAANYTVRQDSGSDNSLGEIRIDMPNKHAVYMHDTPSKRLFARSSRAQSSGCVRVSGVKDLAAWLLETTQGPRGGGVGWAPMDIETAIAGGTRVDARLAKSVPVAWVYLTGYATADGSVQFREDVYGIDDPKPLAPTPAPAIVPEPAMTSSVTLAPRKQALSEQSGRM
jgi:murein L,D-transpeptidase YcbB/YkuD